MLFIVINILYNKFNNSIANDTSDINQNIQQYEYYVKTFSYCLKNNYAFNILFFGLHVMDVTCIPKNAKDYEHNIHILEPYDTYITALCIQFDESYVLAITPLNTLHEYGINVVWKYSRDAADYNKFIISIMVDYYSGKLDYYKKLLKIRSKYGML